MSGLRKRSSGWFAVQNDVAENPDLSFRARGILFYLLAKPDGWDVRSAAIAKDGKEGREAVLSALRELGKAGHYRIAKRHVPVPGKGAQWVTETEVSAEPVPEWIAEWEARKSPESENPSSGEPESGSPESGKPGPGQPDAVPCSTHTKDPQETTSPSPADAVEAMIGDAAQMTFGEQILTNAQPDPFDRFWSLYPKKTGKEAARKALLKALRKTPLDDILAGAERFAADPNLPRKGTKDWQFVPHASTWLNGGRWDDEPLPPRAGGNLHIDEPSEARRNDFERGFE